MSISLTLQCNGPINLEMCNQPATEIERDRRAYQNNTLYRASWIAGVPTIIRAKNISNSEVQFTIDAAEDMPLPDESVIISHLRRKFSLDLDLPAFYAFVRGIPQLSHFPKAQHGLRPILKDSLVEALCLAVMDQQVNVAFAARLKHRVMETYGHCYKIDNLDLWLFPLAKTLAALEDHALTPLQFTRQRSSFVIGLARTFLSNHSFGNMSGDDEDVVNQLCKLRGIGPWTAEYAVINGIGLMNSIPAADIGLMRMVQKVYQLQSRPDAEQVRNIGMNWSPWKGLVTFYLWHQEDLEQQES